MRRYNWNLLAAVIMTGIMGLAVTFNSVASEIPQKCYCNKFVSEFQKPCVTIVSATTVEAAHNVPRHCDIRGMILPDIGFAVKLPDDWNGRFLMVGNGGYAGRIRDDDMPAALQKGYATASTDTGHDVRIDPFGTFAYRNRQKTIDYCFRAVHETAILSKEIIETHYGKPPDYSYFEGFSTGGRQGLMEALRYPEDFDGIIAGCPLLDFSGTQMWGIWNARALEGEGAIPVEKLPALAAAVYKKCDGVDGLVDGVIDDPLQCSFDPGKDVPVCAAGSDGNDCFTTAQVEALKKIYDGVRNSKGELLYPGLSPGAEAFGTQPNWFGFPNPCSGWYGWIIGTPRLKRIVGDDFPGTPSLTLALADHFMKYLAFEVDNPDYDWRTFNFDTDPAKMAYISSILDAKSPDLRAFAQRGGKVLVYHGWSDAAVSPLRSVAYYDDVCAFMGAKTDEFFRLYMVPGAFHRTCGVGFGEVDWLTPMVQWVEKGIAPKEIIGAHRTPEGELDRTRPLCPYPGVAQYKGQGSIDEADNFECGR